MDLSLYLHIPFCVRKCAYCDFPSTADWPGATGDYVDALVREMELRRPALPPDVTAVTLYFGGGTPSLLAPGEIARLVAEARRQYGLLPEAEVTLEANPGTVDRQRLAGYRAAGVNRLSLGFQSLNDAMLALLGRVHTAEEARAAFAAAREAGFTNIGIDLIHSLPGQTAAELEAELREVTALGPEHISAYALSVEEGTPLAGRVDAGELALPDEDSGAEFFLLTRRVLAESGYDGYEISNFARAGRRSRHNVRYWQRGEYLGFGAAAHSFLRDGWGRRWHNPLSPAGYLAAVAAGVPAEDEPHLLSRREAMGEFLFLGLRMAEGVAEEAFEAEFDDGMAAFGAELDRLVAAELLVRQEGRIRLTEKGLLLANQVFSAFV